MSTEVLNFEEIHTLYRPKIERYLARMVGETEAEDLTQEVFVKVHRGLGEFKGDSKLSTWIYRIATNAALDRVRSSAYKAAAETRPLPEAAESFTEASEGGSAVTVEDDSSPERQVFLQQGFECYSGIIKSLPPNYRAVVALSELGELAVDEIATILGLNPSTVKMRLHRGRERLLKELKAHCKPEDWL